MASDRTADSAGGRRPGPHRLGIVHRNLTPESVILGQGGLVKVTDFGIRGYDLAYALLDGYETTILVDACPRGEPAGTLQWKPTA